ncbi:hypothetical protein [uncultured Desulfobacter sp.]|uniref:hypothetical protein n=1 Tax=uncultured Desulfobacter sp. TaxID=240139 RepID=UPI002AAB36A5|nr:hypothetical protein [uncultured Desulfobacter sp.]
MKIKTFFTVMLIIFWGYGNLHASPSTIMEIPAEHRAKMITAWLSQELKLDKTAEKKVHQINLKYAHLNQQELNTYGLVSCLQKNPAGVIPLQDGYINIRQLPRFSPSLYIFRFCPWIFYHRLYT